MLSEVLQLKIKVFIGIFFFHGKLHLLYLREVLNFIYVGYRKSSPESKRFLKTVINFVRRYYQLVPPRE